MDPNTLEVLRADVAELRQELARLRAEADIRRLQYMYGYYDDFRDWDRLIELFANGGCSVEIGSRGKYVGKERVALFFREVIGQNRSHLIRNEIYNHLQLQMVITVDPTATRAHGRSRAMIQGSPGQGDFMMWAEGVYENTFIKEAGVWKIEHMYWAPTFYTKVTGIESIAFSGTPASDALPPDEPARAVDPALGRNLVRYHY